MSEGVLGRDKMREGDKVAQNSTSKPDLTGSYASPINISKEAAADQEVPNQTLIMTRRWRIKRYIII